MDDDHVTHKHETQTVHKARTILLVTDFFYPGLGGVETHVYNLGSCLVKTGYRVIVLTHGRMDRVGVRYMSNGMKVYYYSYAVMYDNCIWAEPFSVYPMLRHVIVRERVDLIHAHQAPSTMCLQACSHARFMNIPCVFTDHSLFGFNDGGAIHLNKLLRLCMSDVAASISVSNTNKENLALRGAIDPNKIFVIPNALDSKLFSPKASLPRGPISIPDVVNIVMISRLTYRKGTDLACGVIVQIQKRFKSRVRFIIGGDGPKRGVLEELRERNGLHDRIEMLGSVSQEEVQQTLRRGHVFLNTSLTEAFCIGILEAACTGLFVVSTNVGGISEVLPHDMVSLCPPSVDRLTEAACEAIDRVFAGELDPWKLHERARDYYDWRNVADRACLVYDHALNTPLDLPSNRIKQYVMSGCTSQWFLVIFMSIIWVFQLVYNYLNPVEDIPVTFLWNLQDMTNKKEDSVALN